MWQMWEIPGPMRFGDRSGRSRRIRHWWPVKLSWGVWGRGRRRRIPAEMCCSSVSEPRRRFMRISTLALRARIRYIWCAVTASVISFRRRRCWHGWNRDLCAARRKCSGTSVRWSVLWRNGESVTISP